MRTLAERPWREPLDAFAALSDAPGARLLLTPDGAPSGRWSVAVAEPVSTLRVVGERALLDGEARSENPFDLWAERMRERAAPGLAVPFASGAVGFVSYEAARFVERSACVHEAPSDEPIMDIGFYDAALVFDRETRRVWLATRAEGVGAEALEVALAAPSRSAILPLRFDISSDKGASDYAADVADLIECIRDGDFFQTNLTRMLSAHADADIDAYALFRAMIAADPAPMAAFLRKETGAVASISPERFLRVTPEAGGLRAIAEPIKGTAPRSEDPMADAKSADQLSASEKDRAENAMIVDLLRNDLAKSCRDGSISVPELCALKSYAGVHHLVSRVEGVLRPEIGAVDALRAAFPCGSITGAPKIEAMRAIARAEARPRGVYTGAIGYIDDAGGADFSVAIRTAEISGRTARYGVGGGVTLLSDPQEEYEETEAKAATFLRALARLGRAAAA